MTKIEIFGKIIVLIDKTRGYLKCDFCPGVSVLSRLLSQFIFTTGQIQLSVRNQIRVRTKKKNNKKILEQEKKSSTKNNSDNRILRTHIPDVKFRKGSLK